MNNYEKLYLLTRLDSIHNLVFSAMLFSSIALLAYFVILFITYDIESEEWILEYKKKWKWVKITSIVLIFVFGLIGLLVPNKNEMIMIYAGGKTMDFIQQDSSINKIPSQTTEIISSFLDKQIKEIEGKTK